MSWEEYHQKTKDRPASPLLTEALKLVANRGSALDVGAGSLVDSKFLIESGFKNVIAIDAVVPPEVFVAEGFKFIHTSFADYTFPQSNFDLINANFSLPFEQPKSFLALWQNIFQSLTLGGIFCGQLLGSNDDWNVNPEMNFHNKESVQKLLTNTEIIKLEEIEQDAPLALGGSKHWHVFAIIYRKPFLGN